MSFKINRFDHITLDYNINVKSLTGIGVCFFFLVVSLCMCIVLCVQPNFTLIYNFVCVWPGDLRFFAVVLLVSFRAVGTAMTLTAAARRKS